MQPASLRAESFASYPPQARALALAHLGLLRQLPLVFAPLLLREWIGYDWRLPAERQRLDRQILALEHMSSTERTDLLAGFRAIPLNAELQSQDWVLEPAHFMETLTAYLWSSRQMDRFRALAERYQAAIDRAQAPAKPSTFRLGLVAIGAGAPPGTQPLFTKLRPFGVHFRAVRPKAGWPTLRAAAAARAGAAQPQLADFRHWSISGFAADEVSPGLTTVSYANLEAPRIALLQKIQQALNVGGMGPEELRSLLARLRPDEVGLSDAGQEGVLNRFQLSLLTEGSGTQIFATTFVQWAARECIRRAEPETLLLRFSPRQQARSMNEMLAAVVPATPDLAGSLVDADMGAYYSWLELRRLEGAENLRFLVWHEDQHEALLIGPGLPRATSSDSPVTVAQLLNMLA